MNRIVEVDLREILRVCLRKAWLIILSAVVFAVAVYMYTAFFVTPLYITGASFYVNNSLQSGESQKISSSDLATSQRLVLTYVNIIKSDTVLEKVAAESGLNLTAGQLRGIMTAESMDDTELFKVQISYPDPQLAAQIANAIATVAPGEISNIMVGSATKVLDYAKVPASPYTPNRARNTAAGALAGAVLAIAIIVIQTLMDVRIKSEEDLARFSPVPVLGVIPDFSVDAEEAYVSKRKPKKQ